MIRKKTASRAKIPRKMAGKRIPIKTNSAVVEEQTLERVERTLKTLESFLARWDASVNKPDRMFPEVVKIKKFYELLKDWRREAVAAKGKGDEESRIRRLRDFIILCRLYS